MHSSTNLPSLTTTLATTTPETFAALHLISDSIAQQRQTAARSIIRHPKTRLLLTAFLLLILTALYKDPSSWPLLLTATTASFLTFLLSIRYITRGYLDEAERVGTLAWLCSDEHPPSTSVTNGDSDSVLVSKYGGKVIGAIVLRAVGFGQFGGHISLERCRELGITARAPVGVIRAWTVVLGYRGVGVGKELLEGAVLVCRERGWQGPFFSERHAHSRHFGFWGEGRVRKKDGWAWGFWRGLGER